MPDEGSYLSQVVSAWWKIVYSIFGLLGVLFGVYFTQVFGWSAVTLVVALVVSVMVAQWRVWQAMRDSRDVLDARLKQVARLEPVVMVSRPMALLKQYRGLRDRRLAIDQYLNGVFDDEEGWSQFREFANEVLRVNSFFWQGAPASTDEPLKSELAALMPGPADDSNDSLMAALGALRDGIDSMLDKAPLVVKADPLVSEGEALAAENVESDAHAAGWLVRVDEWTARTRGWVEASVSPQAANEFDTAVDQDWSTDLPATLEPHNDAHGDALKALHKRVRRLKELTQ